MYLLPEFSRYNNDSLLWLTRQNVGRSYYSVWSRIRRFRFSITKKQYFDPILSFSTNSYLLPGFQSYTYETYMNPQLESSCRSEKGVLSGFICQFLKLSICTGFFRGTKERGMPESTKEPRHISFLQIVFWLSKNW
jgi:hypothetical protein